MSEVTFPPSPYTGQIYVFANQSWQWNGAGWAQVRVASALAIPIYFIDSITAQSANELASVNYV